MINQNMIQYDAPSSLCTSSLPPLVVTRLTQVSWTRFNAMIMLPSGIDRNTAISVKTHINT